jgi:hypothetical protein
LVNQSCIKLSNKYTKHIFVIALTIYFCALLCLIFLKPNGTPGTKIHNFRSIGPFQDTTPPKGLHDHRLAFFPFIMLVKINLIYLPTMYVYCLTKKKIPLNFFPLIVDCRKNLGDLVYLYGTVVHTIIQILLEMFMLLLYIFIFRENSKCKQDRLWLLYIVDFLWRR